MLNINKNIIKQAGAAVANATNKAAGLTAATPEPGTIISAIQLVNGGRTIGPDALAHFTESVRNKLLSLMVNMEPIQDFNGYGHPWPAGGGKNKLDSQAETIGYIRGSNGTFVSGVEAWKCSTVYSEILPNTDYVLHKYATSSSSVAGYAIYDENKNYIYGDSYGSEATVSITTPQNARYIRASWSVNAATPAAMMLATETDTTYAPYSNICPISGRTGANTYVSPTPNVADATTYAADWTTPAGTVYAGSADIVTGDIKAAPYYASYNGETLVGPWVSSMDVYDQDGTPTTGAQVVDLGGTMTKYHITGQDIITLVGDNYIWSDSGDVTIIE